MMHVFISSVIRGFEPYRRAAAEAVEALGYAVLRSEDFGAGTDTPRRACLEAVRKADLTVVLLGERYGEMQASGLSATHEEFREARAHGAVAVFVQQGVEPEDRQAELIEEAREWATGRSTGAFQNAAELRDGVTRSVHQHALRLEAGGVDDEALLARARGLLPGRPRGSASRLHLVVAGGPAREVLAPADLQRADFTRRIMQRAEFGDGSEEESVFDPTSGTDIRETTGSLILAQPDREVEITEEGSVRVTVPAIESDRGLSAGLPVLIEEDVRGSFRTGIRFAGWLLDDVDDLHRLSHVMVLGAVEGGASLGWRTREEHAASPNRIQHSFRQGDFVVVPERPSVRPRAYLTSQPAAIVDDLVARLRRELRP